MTIYIPLFSRCASLHNLKQLHAHLLVTGLHRQPPASTKLIETYYQMGCLHSSNLIFHSFPNPDAFMWGVLIKCHVRNHSFEEVIALYRRMLLVSGGAHMGSFLFPSVLKACGGIRDLVVGGNVHATILKSGLCRDEVIETSLVHMYGEFGCCVDARKVFDDMTVRDLVSWTSLISCYIDHRELVKGLEMFRLLIEEDLELDSVSFINVVDACGELGCLKLGKSLHGYVVRKQLRVCGPLNTSMMIMYSKCHDLLGTEKIFARVNDRSVTVWTAMIASYNRNGCFIEALHGFLEMLASHFEPNFITLISVIGSCAGLGLLREGKSAHCFLLKKNDELQLDSLGPTIIDLYGACGKLNYCENILLTTNDGCIVSWNALISMYSRKGLPKEALSKYLQLQKQGYKPDSFTISSSLSACGDTNSLHLGNQIHCYAYKGNLLTEYVLNSLIDMYCKCGLVDIGYSIFAEISTKSITTWNCMICGFSQAGFSSASVKLLKNMYLNCLEMNEVTFLGALQACSNSGYLDNGKWLHHKLIICGLKSIQIDSSLVDMYSKCGDVELAQKVFNFMPERSMVSWSALIAGYGMHGDLDEALKIFNQMMTSGIKPNQITFAIVLSACSHTGNIQKGKFYFRLMKDLGVEQNWEHYGCLIDLLSRGGDLTGAYEIVKSMPFKVHDSILASLLNGCRIHHRMDVVQKIERELLSISAEDNGCYALLSSIYAQEGNWDGSRKVRTAARKKRLHKVPGFSATIDKGTHKYGRIKDCMIRT